jgi:N-acetylneuraminic acid mutarotase
MFFESLESRRFFADTTAIAGPITLATTPEINVRAKGAAAYENGPVTRFFYIRRGGDLSKPMVVRYMIGGKAHQGIDYNIVGGAVTIKAGNHLRRVEVTPILDGIDENNESVTLTLLSDPAYGIAAAETAATIRIISSEDGPIIPPPPPPPPPSPPPPSAPKNTITWSTRAPSPIERAEALRAVVDNKIYVLGGFSGSAGPVKRSDVYDPAANTWTQIADLPTRLTHAGVAVEGRDVYVAGGYVGKFATGYDQTFGVTNVWKYNVDSNAWTAAPNLPRKLAGGGLVALDRKLYYFGGNDENRNDAADHYALDLDNLAAGWQVRPPIPEAVSHFGYLALGGKIYAVGGQHGNDDALETVKTVQVYDPVANTWSTRADMPVAISHIASATIVLNGRIVVAGGETSHEHPTNRVTAYDPATNTWTSMSNLPSARFSGVAAAIGDEIYFSGGSSLTTTWRGVLS